MAVNKFFWTAVLSFDAVYLPVLLLVQNKRKKTNTVLFICFVSLKNKNIKRAHVTMPSIACTQNDF